MTPTERKLLPTLIDQVVALEVQESGDPSPRTLVAQILVAFDEGATPDLFCIEVASVPDGTWSPKPGAAHSLLLDDIVCIRTNPEPNQ